MGAVNLARQKGLPFDLILKAMSFGFFFDAKNEEGELYANDEEFLKAVRSDFKAALINYLNMGASEDNDLINDLQNLYLQIQNRPKSVFST
jgi:hypothetical protein